MIKPLRHISDFLNLAAAHSSRAAARACREGNYSTPRRVILPEGHPPCWRFTVTSQTGSKWMFWIELLEDERRYAVYNKKVR